MGWNCPECGHLFEPREKMEIKTSSGWIDVTHKVCSNCGAEYITAFRTAWDKDNYVGLLKVWPEPKGIAV